MSSVLHRVTAGRNRGFKGPLEHLVPDLKAGRALCGYQAANGWADNSAAPPGVTDRCVACYGRRARVEERARVAASVPPLTVGQCWVDDDSARSRQHTRTIKALLEGVGRRGDRTSIRYKWGDKTGAHGVKTCYLETFQAWIVARGARLDYTHLPIFPETPV